MERTEHLLEGIAHFKAILENTSKKAEVEETKKTTVLYLKIIQQMQAASVRKESMLSLLCSLLLQLRSLARVLSPESKERLQRVSEEVEPVLMQQMYLHVENAGNQEELHNDLTEEKSAFISLLAHITKTQAATLKLRYFAKRIQSLNKKDTPKKADQLLKLLQLECSRYCSLFGVCNILEENLIGLQGFLCSLIRKNTPLVQEVMEDLASHTTRKRCIDTNVLLMKCLSESTQNSRL